MTYQEYWREKVERFWWLIVREGYVTMPVDDQINLITSYELMTEKD